MEAWVKGLLESFGYLGVALLIFIENVFPPIPSEIILTLGGFMTTYTNLNVWGVSIAATVGSVAGAVLLYGLGMVLTQQRLESIVNRWGKYLRLKMSDIEKAQGWFNKRGSITVFLCRFVPIVRSLISVPAGTARMNFVKFFIYTVLGTAIWNIVLVNLGAFAGENWRVVAEKFDAYSDVALIVLGVLGVAAVVGFVLWRRKKEKETEK